MAKKAKIEDKKTQLIIIEEMIASVVDDAIRQGHSEKYIEQLRNTDRESLLEYFLNRDISGG